MQRKSQALRMFDPGDWSADILLAFYKYHAKNVLAQFPTISSSFFFNSIIVIYITLTNLS